MSHSIVRSGLSALAVSICLFASSLASSANAGFLEDCHALTAIEEEIHICLDNFLDLMDDNMADLSAFIESEFAGLEDSEALAAFQTSQAAFETYRSSNCLWYLAFSSPREEAEQLAKTCLADMSQRRLTELQSLLASDDPGGQEAAGYYVYGAERNSFQFCGKEKKYWVEGETSVVSQLQQTYLSKTTAELQILHARFKGNIDTSATIPFEGYDGVFNISRMLSLRIPTGNDCPLPGKSATEVTAAEPVAEKVEPIVVVEKKVEPPPAEPEQSLIAYFGEWVASCEQLGKSYGCVLTMPMKGQDADAESTPSVPELKITRRSDQRTIVDFILPTSESGGESIEDVGQIQWTVDRVKIGKILHSRLETAAGKGQLKGQQVTRQALRERWFIRDDLLPLMIKGASVTIAVETEGETTSVYKAGLQGLARALAFADDFTQAEGAL